MKVGDMVQTGVWIGGQWIQTGEGRILKDQGGYYDVDINADYAARAEIIEKLYSEVRPIEEEKGEPSE